MRGPLPSRSRPLVLGLLVVAFAATVVQVFLGDAVWATWLTLVLLVLAIAAIVYQWPGGRW